MSMRSRGRVKGSEEMWRDFRNGTIEWSPRTGVREDRGAIRDHCA
ncbi:hypothetical protein ACIGZJ_13030 [Kitasatospora sp. NPDC052868]